MAEKHISDWKHLEVLLTELRAVYDSHLVQQNNGKFKSVSRDGTLMGCVVEVRGEGEGEGGWGRDGTLMGCVVEVRGKGGEGGWGRDGTLMGCVVEVRGKREGEEGRDSTFIGCSEGEGREGAGSCAGIF